MLNKTNISEIVDELFLQLGFLEHGLCPNQRFDSIDQKTLTKVLTRPEGIEKSDNQFINSWLKKLIEEKCNIRFETIKAKTKVERSKNEKLAVAVFSEVKNRIKTALYNAENLLDTDKLDQLLEAAFISRDAYEKAKKKLQDAEDKRSQTYSGSSMTADQIGLTSAATPAGGTGAAGAGGASAIGDFGSASVFGGATAVPASVIGSITSDTPRTLEDFQRAHYPELLAESKAPEAAKTVSAAVAASEEIAVSEEFKTACQQALSAYLVPSQDGASESKVELSKDMSNLLLQAFALQVVDLLFSAEYEVSVKKNSAIQKNCMQTIFEKKSNLKMRTQNHFVKLKNKIAEKISALKIEKAPTFEQWRSAFDSLAATKPTLLLHHVLGHQNAILPFLGAYKGDTVETSFVKSRMGVQFSAYGFVQNSKAPKDYKVKLPFNEGFLKGVQEKFDECCVNRIHNEKHSPEVPERMAAIEAIQSFQLPDNNLRETTVKPIESALKSYENTIEDAGTMLSLLPGNKLLLAVKACFTTFFTRHGAHNPTSTLVCQLFKTTSELYHSVQPAVLLDQMHQIAEENKNEDGVINTSAVFKLKALKQDADNKLKIVKGECLDEHGLKFSKKVKALEKWRLALNSHDESHDAAFGVISSYLKPLKKQARAASSQIEENLSNRIAACESLEKFVAEFEADMLSIARAYTDLHAKDENCSRASAWKDLSKRLDAFKAKYIFEYSNRQSVKTSPDLSQEAREIFKSLNLELSSDFVSAQSHIKATMKIIGEQERKAAAARLAEEAAAAEEARFAEEAARRAEEEKTEERQGGEDQQLSFEEGQNGEDQQGQTAGEPDAEAAQPASTSERRESAEDEVESDLTEAARLAEAPDNSAQPASALAKKAQTQNTGHWGKGSIASTVFAVAAFAEAGVGAAVHFGLLKVALLTAITLSGAPGLIIGAAAAALVLAGFAIYTANNYYKQNLVPKSATSIAVGNRLGADTPNMHRGDEVNIDEA